MSGLTISAVFLQGLPPGDDVQRGHFALDHVDGREDETAARREVFDSAARLVTNVLGRAERKGFLRVATAAPDGQVPAKLSLELGRVIHAPAVDLPRINDVNTSLDQQGKRFIDRAVIVKEDIDLGFRPFLDEFEKRLVVGPDELFVHVE